SMTPRGASRRVARRMRGIWQAGSTTRRATCWTGARGEGPRQKTAWCRSTG
ncbi:hypothetical protein AZ049_003074, partial [Escherichia coli]